jgi:hypothetical protein
MRATSCPPHPFWIPAALDLPVIEHQKRQTAHAILHEGFLDCRIGGERTGLLRQIESPNLDTLCLQPFDVSREPHECIVHLWSTDSGCAAKRGIEKSQGRHCHVCTGEERLLNKPSRWAMRPRSAQ